jgi:hypothetical protein
MSSYVYLLDGEGRNPAHVLELNKYITNNSIIIKDQNRNVYTYFETFDQYIDVHNALTVGDVEFLHHEVIMGFMSQKPKIDIDGAGQPPADLGPYFAQLLAKVFLKEYGETPRIIILDSSGVDADAITTSNTADDKPAAQPRCDEFTDEIGVAPAAGPRTKQSYHMVIPDYAFKSAAQAAYFTRLLVARADPAYLPYLDTGVNKNRQNFRIPGSCKNGRVLRLGNNQMADCLITYTAKCKILPDNPKAMTSPVPTPILPGGPLPRDILEAIDPNTWSLDRQDGGMYVFKRLAASYCDICDRVHEKDGMFIISHKDGRVTQHCFRNSEKKSRTIKSVAGQFSI